MTNWPVSSGHSDGLAIAVGTTALWHEPGWPKFESDRPHSYATREIVAAPGSTELGLTPSTLPWQVMHASALAMLADAALMAGCAAFEVRYVVTPRGSGASATVQMFLTAKTRDWHPAVAQAAVDSACQKLPSGFSWTTPREALRLAGDAVPSEQIVVELRREEEVTEPQWDYIPADFYYAVSDAPGDGAGWPPFWRTLVNVSAPVIVSLLFQQTELHGDERAVLGGVITDLARLSQERTDYDMFGNPVVYPACMNASSALDSWQKRIEQLHRPVLSRLAVRGETAAAVTVATALATAVATSATTSMTRPMYYEPPMTPADVRQADFSFDWLEILPWGGHGIWGLPEAPHSLRRLPYLFGLNEAATLLVLPVPDEQGVPGMARARRVSTYREAVVAPQGGSSDGLRLGRAVNEGRLGSEVFLPLTAINQHALVVGTPGSGKTTTLMHLLIQLWREHDVPFVVIESSKTEYRSLLGTPGMDDLRVITLGNDSVSPLRLNPLAPPQGVRCEVHQSAVMASLKLALPLFPPQPQILAKALERTYDRAGWDDDTRLGDGLAPPTLRDLMTRYQEVFDELGYRGEAHNIGIGFKTRLESLLHGSRGKLLDTVTSSDFAELLSAPLVIEMNEIHDADEKAVLAAFLLDRVRAHAKSRGSSGGVLKHVTVIEEAHRLLAKSTGTGDAATGDNTRADSVRTFCEAIAELRSLGEGFILSSQSPALLADAAVANTSTRIVHRMTSAADRNAMLDDLDAGDRVREAAARLHQGEAVVRWPERDEIEFVQVEPASDIDSGRPVSDETVAHFMDGHRRETTRLLPYRLCAPEVCVEGCTSRVRRSGNEVAAQLGPRAAQLWSEAESSGANPVAEIVSMAANESANDLQRTYCAAVHMSAQDAAFRLRPGQDDRPTIVAAVRSAVGQS